MQRTGRPRRGGNGKTRMQTLFLIFGFILYCAAWLIEFNFHFWQGLSHDVQALAENSIWPASVIMMITGLILIGYWDWRYAVILSVGSVVILAVLFAI